MGDNDWVVAGSKKSAKKALFELSRPQQSLPASRDTKSGSAKYDQRAPPVKLLKRDTNIGTNVPAPVLSERRQKIRREFAKFNDINDFPSLPTAKQTKQPSAPPPTASSLTQHAVPVPIKPVPKSELSAKSVEVPSTTPPEQSATPKTKPKKLSLFDIITQKDAAKHRQKQVLAVPAAPVISATEVTQPPRKKKSKKLSILKKRILSERLKYQIKDQTQCSNAEFYIVTLEHFVTPQDIKDEEERNDILCNVLDILGSVGNPHCIRFRHVDVVDVEVVVDIIFVEKTLALRAVMALNGNVFGGNSVSATLLGHDTITSAISTAANNTSKEIFVLELRNLVSDVDLQDADEKNEVYNDVYSLCSAYGNVSYLAVQASHDSEPPLIVLPQVSVADSWNMNVYSKCALLHYDSYIAAFRAYRRLSRCIIGGVQLHCFFYDIISNDRLVFVPSAATDVTRATFGITCSLESSAVTTLSAFRTVISEVLGHNSLSSECVSVLKKLNLKQINAIASTNTSATIFAPVTLAEYTALVLVGIKAELFSLRSEEESCHALLLASPTEGCIVGVSGYIDEDFDSHPLYFPEEGLAVKRDLIRLASEDGCKRVSIVDWQQSVDSDARVYVTYNSYASALDAMVNLDGSVIAGAHVYATLHWSVCDRRHIAIPDFDNNLEIVNSSETQKGGPIIVSRKKLLSETPKQPKHSAPSKSIQVLSEEMNAKVKELCASLALYQQRAKEKDPLNYKRKERFLLGIKQAINCVKSGRARLLLLAPDTEESDTLDSKLDVLVQEATEKNIPIAYSLKRRALGKAVQSSMRQSVVTIVNPEGAYDEFKLITAALCDGNSDSNTL